MPSVEQYARFLRGEITKEQLQALTDAESATVRCPQAPAADRYVPAASSAPAQQCAACAGTGHVICSSCGGSGSHVVNGSRVGYDGEIEFYTDYLPCGCAGGSTTCGSCGGRG